MMPKLEETIYLDFITSSPTTGAAADADTTPTCEVFEDATDTAILTPTVTKRTSKTGDYRVAVVCTAANGFEAGKSYNVIGSATVGGVTGKAPIGWFQMRARDIDDVMPTYTQPTGFLAATFPSGTIANTTNITAGTLTTVTTVTNLTNAPTVGDLTSTMKTSVQVAVAAQAVTIATNVRDVNNTSPAASSLGAAVNAIPTNPYTGTPPTTAQIATAVWTDTTAGDFTTATSPGKIIFTQLGGAFTTTSSSVFTVSALANAPSGGSAPSAPTIAAAVWDTVLASHLTGGSTGFALNAAGSSGDPWGTALPGAYIAGTAGYIVGNSLASISGLLSSGVTLSAAGLDAVVVESGLNARQALSIQSAVAVGKSAGFGTTTITFAAAGQPSTNRITATLDSNSNRTSVTISPPA